MTTGENDTGATDVASSTGEQLQAARVARGWSLQEVAGRLRIRPALVEAMERDDYAPFGATTYARGQVRNYARLLGLDAQVLLLGFRASEGDSGRPLRRAPEIHPGRPGLVRVGGLAIVVILAVLGAVWAGAGRGPQMPPSTPAAAPQISAQASPVADLPAQSAPPAVVSDVQPDPTGAAVVAEPAPDATTAATPEDLPPPTTSPSAAHDVSDTGVELRLRSRSVSWVEVTDHDGRRLVYELVSPGPERVVRGQPPLRLLLGNAPAVDVLYNGDPVTLPAGQHVVRMTLGAASPPVSSGAPASGPVQPVPAP